MIRLPPRSTLDRSSAASDVYKRQTYNIAQPYALKFLELYIDNAFVKNIPPNTDGTLPLISFNIDSAFIGKYISLYLIYYDLNGTSQKSNTITNLLITADNRIPFKPYNIVLLNFNNGSVNVSWKDSSNNISKYELWRKIGLSGQFSLHQEPVSYTHLRAHETVLDIVCRLLLEKKTH